MEIATTMEKPVLYCLLCDEPFNNISLCERCWIKLNPQIYYCDGSANHYCSDCVKEIELGNPPLFEKVEEVENGTEGIIGNIPNN